MSIPRAKRSGGPKTIEGKLKASRNSLKTGVYSAVSIIQGESLEQYQELEQIFFRRYAPQDILSEMLIKELVDIVWKKQRINKIENTEFQRVFNEPIKSFEIENAFHKVSFILNEELINDVNHYLKYSKEEYIKNQNYSNFLLTQQDKVNVNHLENLATEHQILYQYLIKSNTNYIGIGNTPQEWLERTGNYYDESGWEQYGKLFIPWLKKFRGYVEKAIFAHENEVAIREGLAKVYDQRMIRLIEDSGLERAKATLDNQFSKKLNEFRLHQKWVQNNYSEIIEHEKIKSMEDDSDEIENIPPILSNQNDLRVNQSPLS
ncbi:MAG: hypothetical protein KGN31_01940 [Betaproteobacteria bacterium]|nr:hypothetical protein [Betaproteobacteria bacterium]